VAETNVSPAGKRSVTCTPVAALGPLFVSVMVKAMVSPTLGRALLTILASCRSAAAGFTDVVAVLLDELGSNWSLWVMLAVLAVLPALVTVATMVRVGIAPTPTAPTVQTPLAEA
jgi:hypothetical protein